MAILDIVLLLCFIPAVVKGLSKGLINELISLVSILLGAWLAFKFSGVVSTWLSQYLQLDPKVVNVIAFAIIVILVILLLYFIGQLLTKVVKITTLGWLNRLLGMVFGILKVALVLGLVIMVFAGINAKWGIVKSSTLDDAVIYNALKHFAETVFPYLKSFVTGAATKGAINV